MNDHPQFLLQHHAAVVSPETKRVPTMIRVTMFGVFCSSLMMAIVMLVNVFIVMVAWQQQQQQQQIIVSDLPLPPFETKVPLPGDTVIQETTRILYQNSEKLDYWLQQPPPKVYIYQTLPDHMSVAAVSECIDQKYNSIPKQQLHTASCGWFPKVCNENSTSYNPHYNVYRDNFNSDVFIIQRFQTYKHQTTDPSSADLFLVPYPHRSHCFCHHETPPQKNIYSCGYSFKYIQSNVLNHLNYYNNYTKHRHLFILGSDFALSNPPFRREGMFHVTTGPADGCRQNRHSKGKHWTELCGSITVPFVNSEEPYQPNVMNQQRTEDWWLTRPRKYAMAVVMGTPPQLGIRREFMQQQKNLFGNDGTIGGLPIFVQDIGGRQRFLTNHDDVMKLYQNAIFCPTLAGDDCGQKRFFDVLMSGCIPVVVSYPDSDEPTWPSWFKPQSCSIRRSYPYSVGTFYGDIKAGINFMDFVVQVNGTCGLKCMKSTLEELMNQPLEVTRMRMGLRKYAHLFSYGIGNASSESVDAFSALLVTIRHYLASL